MDRIAVIRVRGGIGLRKSFKDTLNMLRLYKKNNCVVVQNKPTYIGMLNKVKDYVTWGEINNETFKILLENRARVVGDKKLTESYLKEKTNMDFNSFVESFMSFKKELKEIPGLKSFFKLSPPRMGFERGGIKKPYSMGGTLGYRKEAINDLLRRMV